MKPRKPKMGRPPLAPGSAREIVFTIRLTEAERDAIVRAAKTSGGAPTKWAREALVAAAERAYPALDEPSGLGDHVE